MPEAGKGAALRDFGESDYKRNCQPQLGRDGLCLGRLRDPAGWPPLPCPRHRLGAQAGGPRRTGQVAPSARAAAGRTPRNRRDWLRPGTVATASTSKDPSHHRSPPENRRRGKDRCRGDDRRSASACSGEPELVRS